jgi:hypothetical protein
MDMAVDRYEELLVDVAAEHLVELPARLETSAFFSPVTYTLTQGALALNAVNVGGTQVAAAANVANTAIIVG